MSHPAAYAIAIVSLDRVRGPSFIQEFDPSDARSTAIKPQAQEGKWTRRRSVSGVRVTRDRDGGDL